MVLKIVKIKFEDEDKEVYGVLDTSDGFFLTYEDVGVDKDGVLLSSDLNVIKRLIGVPDGTDLRGWEDSQEGFNVD